MKVLVYKKIWSIILLAVLSAGPLMAEESSRHIEQSFDIKSDTRIEVDNKFGSVVINNWDKNIVQLKVEIKANSNSESRVRDILDAIDVNITDRVSSGYLSFKTNIGSMKGKAGFSVNYEINMPAQNAVRLKNSFGNVFMESRQGELEAEVKYGQFQAEDLDNADVRVEFSPSKCEIETLKQGKIDLRYSKMDIDECGDIEISSQFSDLKIDDAGMLNVDSRYGSLKLGEVEGLRGDIQFSGVDISKLQKSIVLVSNQGNGLNIEQVSKDFEKIDIENQFSSISLRLPANVSSALHFELKFGNLKAYGDGINFTRVTKDMNSSEYEGYLGSKSGTSSVRVSNSYGNIKLKVE